ncbi:MAG: methionine synthase [Scytolyngbya sp. HA4215-MV1]|jgi:hypothetical protein|nr:methionine synthase [Scytolyngbya sp. HA4215-MV1]
MRRGIYIVANDKVGENAIALLNSIRFYDPDTEVFLIPFNDEHQTVFAELQKRHNVQLFPDLDFLNQFTDTIANIFDRDFLALPNKMRKLVAWSGPLDEFLYIDTDIIVFEKIANVMDHLAEAEFLCCDFHFKGRGLNDVFSSLVKEQGLFSDEQLQDVFNSGFWASKKSALPLERMVELLRECAAHREYFDFSRQTTDQPIMNYLVLRSMPRRVNLVKLRANEPGSWAGSPNFQEKDHILYDRGTPLRYLHWAGTPMKAGSPYRELWEHYRYLHEPRPVQPESPDPIPNSWQELTRKVTRKIKSAFQ